MGLTGFLLTSVQIRGRLLAAAVPEAPMAIFPAKLKERSSAFIGLPRTNEVGEVTSKRPTNTGEYPFLCKAQKKLSRSLSDRQ